MAYYGDYYDRIDDHDPPPERHWRPMTTAQLPPDLRILVTGSRTWPDAEYVAATLVKLIEEFPDRTFTIVHGGARRGVDRMADFVARLHGWLVEVHPADWDSLGFAAGPARNREMVNAGADLCLAFIHQYSAGATHCAGAARLAGIEVRIYRWEEVCQSKK